MTKPLAFALSLLAAVVLSPRLAWAQADEIQVYDGGLAGPRVFNLTLHTNVTPNGIKTPAFPGAVVAHKSLNGVPEWAYGVTRWFEAGLYLPLYSRDDATGWGLDGFKLRTLFAVPNADDRKFLYGVNIEYSYNARRWDTKRFTSEIRPIVGWHFTKVDLIINPIVDTAYDGVKNLEFVPATRLAYNLSKGWAIAGELYQNFGRVSEFLPRNEQAHQAFFVVNHTGQIDIEMGVGFGLTEGSDKLTLKLILAKDLIKPAAPKK